MIKVPKQQQVKQGFLGGICALNGEYQDDLGRILRNKSEKKSA